MLWNEVDSSPITARDIKGAQALITEALSRRFFKDRFEMAPDAEQRYLAAMADLGDGPVRSADVALRRGVQGPGKHVGAAREFAAEGPGLQPAAGARGLHGAAVRRVPAGAASAG